MNQIKPKRRNFKIINEIIKTFLYFDYDRKDQCIDLEIVDCAKCGIQFNHTCPSELNKYRNGTDKKIVKTVIFNAYYPDSKYFKNNAREEIYETIGKLKRVFKIFEDCNSGTYLKNYDEDEGSSYSWTYDYNKQIFCNVFDNGKRIYEGLYKR